MLACDGDHTCQKCAAAAQGLMGLACGCTMPMSGLGELGKIFPYKTSTCEKLKARIDLLAGPKYKAKKYQTNRALFVEEYARRCGGAAPISISVKAPVTTTGSQASPRQCNAAGQCFNWNGTQWIQEAQSVTADTPSTPASQVGQMQTRSDGAVFQWNGTSWTLVSGPGATGATGATGPAGASSILPGLAPSALAPGDGGSAYPTTPVPEGMSTATKLAIGAGVLAIGYFAAKKGRIVTRVRHALRKRRRR